MLALSLENAVAVSSVAVYFNAEVITQLHGSFGSLEVMPMCICGEKQRPILSTRRLLTSCLAHRVDLVQSESMRCVGLLSVVLFI